MATQKNAFCYFFFVSPYLSSSQESGTGELTNYTIVVQADKVENYMTNARSYRCQITLFTAIHRSILIHLVIVLKRARISIVH